MEVHKKSLDLMDFLFFGLGEGGSIDGCGLFVTFGLGLWWRPGLWRSLTSQPGARYGPHHCGETSAVAVSEQLGTHGPPERGLPSN